MAKVTAPKAWGNVEQRLGVEFKDGVGHTSDPAKLAFFARQGYDVERKRRRSSQDSSSQANSSGGDAHKGGSGNGVESGADSSGGDS